MVKFLQHDNIGILILNRPEKRNSLHPELIKQLKEKLIQLDQEPSIEIIILTGEGTSFCAGADLDYLNTLAKNSLADNESDSESLAEMFLLLYNFSKPTIAAVNGPAIAGGCGLASVCDFIFAHPSISKFGFSEVKIGFIPAIVSIFLIKKLGEGKATQMLLSGEIIVGKKAFDFGLVNYLSENVLEDSVEYAKKLTTNSVNSMIQTKRMIRNISGMNIKDAVKYCQNLNVISRTTNDFKNGINDFLNKTQKEK